MTCAVLIPMTFAFVVGFLFGRAQRVPRPFHRHVWRTGTHYYSFTRPSPVRICLDPTCGRIEFKGDASASWIKIDGDECPHLQATARRLVDVNA